MNLDKGHPSKRLHIQTKIFGVMKRVSYREKLTDKVCGAELFLKGY